MPTCAVRHERSLAIFDVDGTLTRTQAIDADCFIRALALELEIGAAETDWSAYLHTTDLGIAQEILERRRGRRATEAELARLRAGFARLLAEAADADASAFVEIAGAGALVASLRTSTAWAAAIATGGWRDCALLKLARAGIDAVGLPAAFAEDGPAREAIVSAALARAGGPEGFARVVCVGDAVWDARTARQLHLPFVGVAINGRAMALRSEGVTEIIPDLRDPDAVLHALALARVPSG